MTETRKQNPWQHYRDKGSLSAPQVAEILGVSAQTVLRMADEGRLPFIDLSRPSGSRRTRRFPTPAIIAMAANHAEWLDDATSESA
jgi:excisionase family DNA binding protein